LRPSAFPLAAPALLALALSAVHCAVDRAPEGLRATPPGTGPRVVFDLERRPLPEIPQPNDVATFADPTSRTGRRINVSLVAPTTMETKAREGFSEMEGWGTYAPLTVAFTRADGADPRAPAIDLDDVRTRMHRDVHDLRDDPVYVVNLTTGVPVILDMGDGNFPLTMRDLDAYWPNDLKAKEQNLLFESQEEGAGLGADAYTPALDRDFDGVLDHPNTFGPLAPDGIAGVDDLLTWYERESDTLILRPLLPMEEKTEYAVVLTDRLRAADGRPVRSPFAYIHHPQQKDGVARLQSILADDARKGYFGDLAGTGLDHVAFAWTFTTQPTYEDLRLLRDGLYGRGPFASFAAQFPPKATAFRAVGLADNAADEPDDLASHPECQAVSKWPFAVNVVAGHDMIAKLTDLVLQKVFTLSDPQQKALLASFDSIDHVVLGSFESPYLLGDDPAHEDPDDWFHVNFQTGAGRVARDTVHFFLTVPKATATQHQPFPVTTWAHGTGLFDAQAIIRAGYLARQGLGTFAIDMPGHGLVMDAGLKGLANIFLKASCYDEWVNGLVAGRAHDLNGDARPDSGGYVWTSHIFHNRDNIRQAVLDEMQAVRLLRSFDGVARSDQDYSGDGAPDLAGDFDGDGTPDVGGPDVAYTTGGDSLGGIVAMIHGAIDPYVTASTPISGGAGLLDIALHSSLTPTPVLEQTLSPLVIAVPASERGATATVPTACSPDQRSVRFVVNDLFDSRELEIACVDTADLGENMTVLVVNFRNQETRCVRTGADGRLRIPVPANVGDKLAIEVLKGADLVTSYGTCELTGAASNALGRVVSTWEIASPNYVETNSGATCTSDTGCAQFREQFYPVGSTLVAPQEGIGYQRQTPITRRLFTLAQAGVDPADPINFAAYYLRKPVPDVDGHPLPPRSILATPTAGDPMVPIAAGIAFARAAGAVPFLPPSALATMPEYADFVAPDAMMHAWGETPNDVLLDNHVIEGLARLGRTAGGAACGENYAAKPPTGCTRPTDDVCSTTLFDADWSAEGADLYDAAHLAKPLRLARSASVHATDATSLNLAWAPRLAVMNAGVADVRAWDGPTVGLAIAYVNPVGQHVFKVADPCKAFDDSVYYIGLLARFLATNGNDRYDLTHPLSHRCLADQSCPFFASEVAAQ
jgi:hypothetical protein